MDTVAQITQISGLLVQFALFGGGLVSELYLAYGLVIGGTYASYGVAIYTARLLHLLPSGLVINSLASSSTSDKSFKGYLESIHFFKNAFPYSLLFFLCLVESPLLQYLPWKCSPFANVAGFPNLFLLRFALVIKTMQNVMVLVCQFTVLTTISSSTSLTQNARDFLYINLAITLTVAILGLIEGFLKRTLLSDSNLSFLSTGIRNINNANKSSPGLEMRESTVNNPLAFSVSSASAAAFVAGSEDYFRDSIPARSQSISFSGNKNNDIISSSRMTMSVQTSDMRNIEGKIDKLEMATKASITALGSRIDALEATRPLLARIDEHDTAINSSDMSNDDSTY